MSLNACIRTTTEDIPWNTEPVPVVFSIISPGRAVEVVLSKTQQKKQSVNESVYPHAKVFFAKENTAWIELTRVSLNSPVYTDSENYFEIEPGKTYLLKVEIDNLTLYAENTLPCEKATITNAVYCETKSFYNYSYGTLKVDMKFSKNKEYAYFLYALSSRVNEEPFLNSESFFAADFYIENDIAEFNLNLITCDPYLEKYLKAEYIANNFQNFSDGDVNAIIFSYGGVTPDWSNVKRGIGLFGSYLVDVESIRTEENGQ